MCRFLANFDDRLKNILELSDAVVCAELGACMHYALYLNKPVGYIKCGLQYENQQSEERSYCKTPTFDADIGQFERLFDERLHITPEQMAFMNCVSGFGLVRDPEYIRNILHISKDIWRFCEYDTTRYPAGVYIAYDKYVSEMDIKKARILRNVVGKNSI